MDVTVVWILTKTQSDELSNEDDEDARQADEFILKWRERVALESDADGLTRAFDEMTFLKLRLSPYGKQSLDLCYWR